MHSTTKISLTDEQLCGITVHALGRRTDGATELTDGWFNTIYRLELDDGRRVVIKISPPPGHPVMRYERDRRRGRVALEAIDTPRLVLWDLHPGNVFVSGGRVTGIIDVDRALWGDPLMEFFFRSFANATPEFLGAYRGESAPIDDEAAARRIWLYDLYLALIMIVECSFRGFEDGHRDWARRQLVDVARAAAPAWIDRSFATEGAAP